MASIGTTTLFLLLSVAAAAFRPALPLDLLILLLLPLFLIGWLIAAFILVLKRRWPAALFALTIPIFIASWFVFGFSPYTFVLSAVQHLEFEARRSEYDAIVAKVSQTSIPRLVRVAELDTSTFCCNTQTFEEIWFDESDSLDKSKSSERDQTFWSSHPSLLGHTQYSVRVLGHHYYFLDIWY